MEKTKIQNVIDSLEGVTYLEWKKIKSAVEFAYDLKRKEHENSLTLSTNEIEKVIHSQFG